MLKEALQFELTEDAAKLVIDETLFQPTDVEEKAKCDVFWEVSETARRKVCVTRTFYQNDPNQCYFTIKLFIRGTEENSFRRKCFLSVRIGELQKLHRMSNDIVSVLNKVKNQTKSQSALKYLYIFILYVTLFIHIFSLFELNSFRTVA